MKELIQKYKKGALLLADIAQMETYIDKLLNSPDLVLFQQLDILDTEKVNLQLGALKHSQITYLQDQIDALQDQIKELDAPLVYGSDQKNCSTECSYIG